MKRKVLSLIHPSNPKHSIQVTPEQAGVYRSQGWIDEPKPKPVTGTK